MSIIILSLVESLIMTYEYPGRKRIALGASPGPEPSGKKS